MRRKKRSRFDHLRFLGIVPPFCKPTLCCLAFEWRQRPVQQLGGWHPLFLVSISRYWWMKMINQSITHWATFHGERFPRTSQASELFNSSTKKRITRFACKYVNPKTAHEISHRLTRRQICKRYSHRCNSEWVLIFPEILILALNRVQIPMTFSYLT